MEDNSSVFQSKYASLKRTFEARLGRLADVFTNIAGNVVNDPVFLQLLDTESTKHFAPAHAQRLIKRELASERNHCFHDLALKLANAEGDAHRFARRNTELSNLIRVLKVEAKRGELSRTEVGRLTTEIQELRDGYQREAEKTRPKYRQMAMDLAVATRRLADLSAARQELEARSKILQAALVDADVKGTALPRVELQLGEARSTIATLTADLSHARERLGEFTADHQRLKFQVQSLRNDVKEREERLFLESANKQKSEVRFRDAVARMTALLNDEANDSSLLIKDLRDKARLTKGRLTTEIEKLRASKSDLEEALSAATTKIPLLDKRIEAAHNDKEMSDAKAIAKQEVLNTELEQSRARAYTMSQSLAEAVREQSGLFAEVVNAKAASGFFVSRHWSDEFEKVLADKIEEASTHISELRTMLGQEIKRRVAAEAEVSEAHCHLESSHWELDQLRNLGRKLEKMGRSSVAHIAEKNRTIAQLESQICSRHPGDSAARHAGQNFPLEEGKLEHEAFLRQFVQGVRFQADRFKQASQGVPGALFNSIGVSVPTNCSNSPRKKAQGALEEGSSDFTTAFTEAITNIEENSKQTFLMKSNVRPQHTAVVSCVEWGGRSKEDFNMLAELQKIKVESELQSLRAQLVKMTEKYSGAVAARDAVAKAPMQEEHAMEELARALKTKRAAVVALEATLETERKRCRELKLRLERQTRDHRLSQTRVSQDLLRTQHRLDEVQYALEQAQFMLDREVARRSRLEKKLDEAGLAQSTSSPTGRSSEARNETALEMQGHQPGRY